MCFNQYPQEQSHVCIPQMSRDAHFTMQTIAAFGESTLSHLYCWNCVKTHSAAHHISATIMVTAPVGMHQGDAFSGSSTRRMASNLFRKHMGNTYIHGPTVKQLNGSEQNLFEVC